VRDGRLTDAAWQAMVTRMTQRGAVEYTIFIMFLNLTIRLIEAFTGDESAATPAEIQQMIADYQSGARDVGTLQAALRAG
jgi:hypothetical protein